MTRQTSFTYVVEPDSDADAGFDALLARAAASELEERLLETGAILFRGFAVETAAQLGKLADRLSGGGGLFDYRGGASPRRPLGAGTYNSTEYPPHIELPLHNELSYSDAHPARIFFLCLEPPGRGGETTLADSRRILEAIPDAVRDAFERKGVRYVRILPPGRGTGYSWQDAFECDDPVEAERRCEASGAEWEWLDRGFLRIIQERPATAVHPRTGEAVWFNQADGFHPSALDLQSRAELLALCGSEDRFRLNVRYGDGSEIEPESLAAIRAVLAREAYPHEWRRGDVLMLDNFLTAHGRRPFEGRRQVATAMS